MTQDRKKRILLLLAVLFGTGLLLSFLLFVWQPPCLILQRTGFYCAGCGGQRMAFALLRGDFASAFRYNPFLFCVLPPLCGYLLWEGVRFVRKERPLCRMKYAWIPAVAILAAATVFSVLRNLPAFSFLAPPA